eukprot:151048-Amphidinium_carterae.3
MNRTRALVLPARAKSRIVMGSEQLQFLSFWFASVSVLLSTQFASGNADSRGGCCTSGWHHEHHFFTWEEGDLKVEWGSAQTLCREVWPQRKLTSKAET